MAPVDDVLAAWAGLGYYARARNLHKTAKIVAYDYAGVFPKNKQDLLALPGIGPYTAGAIMVMGYGQPGVVVDGNIERVMSRYFAIQTPLPKAKAEIACCLCRQSSRCPPVGFSAGADGFCQCRLQSARQKCRAAAGVRWPAAVVAMVMVLAEQLPRKAAKPAKPRRWGVAFVAINQHDEVFVERRPDSGLLGGMTAFPSSGWTQAHRSDADAAAFDAAPFDANWQKLQPAVQHVFTHFALDMTVYVARVHAPLPVTGSGWWQKPKPSQLPSLMRKIWKQVEGCRSATGGFKDKPSSRHGDISVIS